MWYNEYTTLFLICPHFSFTKYVYDLAAILRFYTCGNVYLSSGASRAPHPTKKQNKN